MTRNTGPSPTVLALVKGRLHGLCLRCGARGDQCHHRIPRGMGGTHDPVVNTAPALVWVCGHCHQEIESRRTESYRSGWLCRRGSDPAAVPLITLYAEMIMLDEFGGMVSNPLPDPAEDLPWEPAR